MDACLEEPAAKRRKVRKVRKGTHSCWECRRRKVKCIFASSEAAACITCDRRGTECVSQEDLEGADPEDIESSYASQRPIEDARQLPETQFIATDSAASSAQLSRSSMYPTPEWTSRENTAVSDVCWLAG